MNPGAESPTWGPVLCLLVAVLVMSLLRFCHLAALEGGSVLFHRPMVDALEYLNEAQARASGTFAYRVPGHAPLYPTLLGHAYSLVDGHPSHLFWLRVIQSLTGQLTALLLFFGGRRWIGAWPAAVAALLFALYRPGLLYECELYAAGLANLFVTAVVVFLVGSLRGLSFRVALAFGLCLGLAAITRSNLLLLTPVAAIVLGLARCSWKKVLVVVLAAAIPVAAVTLENYRASGEWILIQGRTGQNLHMANHAGSDGTVDIRPGPLFEHVRRRPMVEADAWTAGERDVFYLGLVREFVTEHPGEFVGLLARKAWNSLSPVEVPSALDNESNARFSWVLRELPLPGFAWLLPLALIGLVVPIVCLRTHLAAVAVFAAVWLTLVLVFPTGRYRYQLAGLLCLFAAAGLRVLYGCWREKQWRRTTLAGAALIAGLLGVYLAPRFAAQRDSWRAEFHQLQAYSYLLAQRFNDAHREAAAAVRLDPNYAWPHYTLGMVNLYSSRFDQARTHFTAAIHRFEQFPDAYLNRALTHIRAIDPEDPIADRQAAAARAVADLRRTVELVPFRHEAWENLGNVYERMGRDRDARQSRNRGRREKIRVEAHGGER